MLKEFDIYGNEDLLSKQVEKLVAFISLRVAKEHSCHSSR